jgi:hypothetical protein
MWTTTVFQKTCSVQFSNRTIVRLVTTQKNVIGITRLQFKISRFVYINLWFFLVFLPVSSEKRKLKINIAVSSNDTAILIFIGYSVAATRINRIKHRSRKIPHEPSVFLFFFND